MSDLAQSAPPSLTSEPADYEAALKQVMAEVDYLNGLMRQDRDDIERLKAESGALKAETRALLASMGASL